MRKQLIYITFMAMLAVLADACKHEPLVPKGGEDPGTPPGGGVTCDTTNVTYYGSVFPVFQAHCIGCHGGESPSGNIDLNDYNQVAIIAQNGALLGSLQHEANFSAMPKGKDQLDDCLVRMVEIWINDTTFTEPEAPNPCDPDTVYFELQVLPIFQSSCALSDCHDATAEDGIRLDSYEAVMLSDVIKAYDPGDSELFDVINETDPERIMPPPPNLPLGQDQIALIRKWIEQGAQNLYCDEICDTTDVSFSDHIWQGIIQPACFGCHSGPEPGGGIPLENYDDVWSIGDNGQLTGVVNHQAGYTPMPKNGNKLSDCKITAINKWIEDGMPDN